MAFSPRHARRLLLPLVAVGIAALGSGFPSSAANAAPAAGAKTTAPAGSLRAQLDQMRAAFGAQVPESAKGVMDQAQAEIAALELDKTALHRGDHMPDFTLPDPQGKQVALATLLTKGPVVITFYRGSWCPYCNLALKAMQDALPEIRAAGATLVAITPELPGRTVTLQEKQRLTFDVLTDHGNVVARQFGLVFQLPVALRPLYAAAGIDLVERNGDGNYELPMPATYVVTPDRLIQYAFVDIDYSQRAEPADVVSVLKALRPAEPAR